MRGAARGDRGWEERRRWGRLPRPERGGKAPTGIPEPVVGRAVPGAESGVEAAGRRAAVHRCHNGAGRRGRPGVVIIGMTELGLHPERAWKRRFEGDCDVLGSRWEEATEG